LRKILSIVYDLTVSIPKNQKSASPQGG